MSKSIVLFLLLVVASSALPAQPSPTTLPALEQLNAETKALYAQVQPGVYRVELPEPKWLNAYAMAPISKWDQRLDPEVRKRLADARVPIGMTQSGASEGSLRPDLSDTTTLGQSKYIAVRPLPVEDSPEPVLGARLE